VLACPNYQEGTVSNDASKLDAQRERDEEDDLLNQEDDEEEELRRKELTEGDDDDFHSDDLNGFSGFSA
jgi:hypothetical protein